MRNPMARYFKEEVGGLLMGVSEPDATPWQQSASIAAASRRTSEFSAAHNWEILRIRKNAIGARARARRGADQQFYTAESFTLATTISFLAGAAFANVFVGCRLQNSTGIARAVAPARHWPMDRASADTRSVAGRYPPSSRRLMPINRCPIGSSKVLGLHTRCVAEPRAGISASFQGSPLFHLCAMRRLFRRYDGGRGEFFAPSQAQARIIRLDIKEMAPVGAEEHALAAKERRVVT